MTKISLSIILMKESVAGYGDAVREGVTTYANIENVGRLYYGNSQVKPASSMLEFFGDSLPVREDGRGWENVFFTSAVQSVLIVPIQIEEETRFFAICFGFGKNLINADIIQEKFGMKVVLNSIAPNTIRSVDVNILESVPKHDRVQSSRLSEMNTFNLDVDRDLLRAVTGKTKEEYENILGKTVTGADPLKISDNLAVNGIVDRLRQIYDIYQKEDYKENFSWVDNITPVKDTVLRSTLDGCLIDKINHRELDKIWMSLPELVDWNDICKVRFSPKGTDFFDDIEITDVLEYGFCGDQITLTDLKSSSAYAFNGADLRIGIWSLYRCVYAEMEIEGVEGQYVISNGQWYRVDQDFVNEVNDYYNSVQLSTLDLLTAHTNEEEGAYNKRASDANSATRLLMDKRCVVPGANQDKIEFCDIYTIDKNLIHVKRYSSSATLSHLFNQGSVAGELLMQSSFREKLNDKLNDLETNEEHRDLTQWKVNVADGDFHREQYNMVFAIISSSAEERPPVPFFSKITLRNVSQRLEGFGYHVFLKNIKIDDIDVNPELTEKRRQKKEEKRARRTRARRGA